MPELATFDDFVLSTAAKIKTGPNDILNDATLNTYFIKRSLKGREAAEVVRSGSSIEDRVQLKDTGTGTFYNPNDEMDIQSVDTLTKISVPWRFFANHFVYTQEEMELNGQDPQTYLKNLLKSKRQGVKTDTFNTMERNTWAAPDYANMGSPSAKRPLSIPALVTTDGLAPAGFNNMVLGVDVTQEPGWRNQVAQYDHTDVDDEADGLLAAMDRMWYEVQFESPTGGMQEYFESDRLQKMVIATNLDGVIMLQGVARRANDRLVPATNLGYVAGRVTYAGLPIDYVSTLNTSPLVNGGPIPSGRPWFYYLNLNYLFTIFHANQYMKEAPPLTPVKQPFSRVVWSSTYYNWFMRSRRRQGIVRPATIS